MEILIVGKKNSNCDWEEINKNNSIGQYYSQDRYFTILNEFIDSNLKKHAKLVFFLISYMMRSTNYKHETSISNGKSIWVWILDIFCWICTIGFLICFATGIATPIVNAFKSGNILEAFDSTTAIGLLVTSLLTFIVTAFYLYMMIKVVAKNKKLNLSDYVFKKIDYLLKFSPLVNINSKIFSVKKENFLVVEKVEELTNINRWITLQITNLMYKMFSNFNMVLKISGIEKEAINELSKIIEHDFKNIEIVILKTEEPENTNENSSMEVK